MTIFSLFEQKFHLQIPRIREESDWAQRVQLQNNLQGEYRQEKPLNVVKIHCHTNSIDNDEEVEEVSEKPVGKGEGMSWNWLNFSEKGVTVSNFAQLQKLWPVFHHNFDQLTRIRREASSAIFLQKQNFLSNFRQGNVEQVS